MKIGLKTSTKPTAPRTAPSGTFKPNEDTTHEEDESAARDVQEDARQMRTAA
jgi:hypothetical protein